MDAIFPIGFPWPTAMYLTFFIVTSVIYMLFMQYVLAGGIVLVVGCLLSGVRKRAAARASRSMRPGSGLGLIESVLRDWLPAILGLAIATGVAPLLFLQVLYKRPFYTANLVLSNRFMLLLPALIVAYSMLYLLKGHALAARGVLPRTAATLVACACFLYTTWAWTENHVLSLHPEVWRDQFASDRWIYRNSELWPRLGFWITSSFTVLAAVLAWQLHWGRGTHDSADLDRASMRLRALALLGLATSAFEAWIWQLWLEPPLRAPIVGMLALPYGFLALLGIGIQAAAWLPVKAGADLGTRRLAFLSVGVLITIVGVLVVREARRLAAIDIAALYESHRQAAQVGGMGVFLVSFALNAGLITACVLIVRHSLGRSR